MTKNCDLSSVDVDKIYFNYDPQRLTTASISNPESGEVYLVRRVFSAKQKINYKNIDDCIWKNSGKHALKGDKTGHKFNKAYFHQVDESGSRLQLTRCIYEQEGNADLLLVHYLRRQTTMETAQSDKVRKLTNFLITISHKQ